LLLAHTANAKRWQNTPCLRGMRAAPAKECNVGAITTVCPAIKHLCAAEFNLSPRGARDICLLCERAEEKNRQTELKMLCVLSECLLRAGHCLREGLCIYGHSWALWPLWQVAEHRASAAGSCTRIYVSKLPRNYSHSSQIVRHWRKMRFKHLDPNNSASKLNFA
jgi:hypothetical protein